MKITIAAQPISTKRWASPKRIIEVNNVAYAVVTHNVAVGAILPDGGREYCGRADQHRYELYLGSQNIDH